MNVYFERNALTLVVFIAFFARIALLIFGKTYIFPENWPEAYKTGNIAAAIAETDTFSSPFGTNTGPTAWLMPGYPYLLSSILHATGRIWDTTLFTTMSIFFLIFLLRIENKWTINKVLLAGILFGIIALFRVIILALYPSSKSEKALSL